MGLALSAVLLTGVVARAQTTQPPSYQRDGEIYFDSTPSSREAYEGTGSTAAVACVQRNKYVEFRGMNLRTVGNGLSGIVDSSGKLVSESDGTVRAIRDSLLSPMATIRITTFGKDAQGNGKRPSRVFVNEFTDSSAKKKCEAKQSLVFHYGPATSNQIYIQELEVDASCLRYGVRSSESASKPEAKENFVRIETDEMLPDKLATECGDHGGSWVSASLEGDATWWTSAIYPSFAEIWFRPVSAGGGEQSARLNAAPHSMIVKFEALAPIALVHGYTSDIAFWNRAVADPDGETIEDAFMTPLTRKSVAFERISTRGSVKKKNKQPNIYPAPASEVGDDIAEELKRLAASYGADSVNIVAHSLGTIWTRAALDHLHAVWPQDIGVYNAVTLAGAHNGSVLGDIQHVVRDTPEEGNKYQAINFPGRLRIGSRFANFDETVIDATTWKAEGHAKLVLPPSFLVKGKKTPARYWALPTSFNVNENCDGDGYDLVECDDPNECKRYGGGLGRRRLLTERSRAIQGYRQVVLATPGNQFPPETREQCGYATSPANGIVRACLVEETATYPTPGCSNRKPLNDFTLRTAGMLFPGFTNLVPRLDLPKGVGGPYLLYNHSTIAHSAVANALMWSVLNAKQQQEQKR
jgi:pimeloyl-ACP methyl ester carboxylesterase